MEMELAMIRQKTATPNEKAYIKGMGVASFNSEFKQPTD